MIYNVSQRKQFSNIKIAKAVSVDIKKYCNEPFKISIFTFRFSYLFQKQQFAGAL